MIYGLHSYSYNNFVFIKNTNFSCQICSYQNYITKFTCFFAYWTEITNVLQITLYLLRIFFVLRTIKIFNSRKSFSIHFLRRILGEFIGLTFWFQDIVYQITFYYHHLKSWAMNVLFQKQSQSILIDPDSNICRLYRIMLLFRYR